MTAPNDSLPPPADDEGRLAKRLRELEERLHGGDNGNWSFDDRELTPDQVVELMEARECLQLLELANPALYPETLQPRPSTVGDQTSPPATDVQSPAGSTMQPAVVPDVQHEIGRYIIGQQIGSGGFGVVFRAYDPQLDREVALKIPRPEAIASASSRNRFLREARTAACLSHPAIVPIFEAGNAGPVVFIAYELCRGQTLQQWLNQHPPPIDSRLACQILSHVAQAVQHAHSRGIIHRDLKPSNLVLNAAHLDDPGSPLDVASIRVTDFGLAQVETPEEHSLTASGAPLGTPAYMSPEQVLGTRKVTPASDIYSLGAIFYQLLTGQVPFQRESNVLTLEAIIRDPVASPRRLNPQINRDVAAICLKCLEKDPARRYTSCQALEDDLTDFLAGRVIMARTPNAMERTWRWCGRYPVLATTVALLIVSLMMGVAVSGSFWWRSEISRRSLQTEKLRADGKAAEALTQARLARAAVDELQRAIADEPFIQQQAMRDFRRKLLSSAGDYYQQVSVAKPDDRDVLSEHIEILIGLGRLHAMLGDLEKGVEIWREAIGLIEAQFPQQTELLEDTRGLMADSLAHSGRHDEAIDMARLNVESVRSRRALDASPSLDQRLADFFRQMADALSLKGDNLQAGQVLDEAIGLMVDSTGLPPDQWTGSPELAALLKAKSEVALQLLKHDDVQNYAPLALKVYEQLSPNHDREPAERLVVQISLTDVIGTSHAMRGEFTDATEYFQREGQLVDQLLQLQPDVAANHGRFAHQVHRMAKTLYESGNVQAAQEWLLAKMPEMIAVHQRYPEIITLSEKVVLCQQLMAKTYRRQGDLDTAIIELQKSIVWCQAVLLEPQASLVIQNHLGSLYLEMASYLLQQHRFDAAADECERALDILEPLYRQQPAGEIQGMLEFAYNLTGNVFNRVDRQSDYLDITAALRDWPRNSPAIVKAKCYRIVALAMLHRWDESWQELESLSGTVDSGAVLMDVAGTSSKCAGMIAANRPEDAESQKAFVDLGLQLLRKMNDSGMLNDPKLVGFLREHEDFASLRSTDEYAELMPD